MAKQDKNKKYLNASTDIHRTLFKSSYDEADNWNKQNPQESSERKTRAYVTNKGKIDYKNEYGGIGLNIVSPEFAVFSGVKNLMSVPTASWLNAVKSKPKLMKGIDLRKGVEAQRALIESARKDVTGGVVGALNPLFAYGGILNNNNDMRTRKRQYGNRFNLGGFNNITDLNSFVNNNNAWQQQQMNTTNPFTASAFKGSNSLNLPQQNFSQTLNNTNASPVSLQKQPLQMPDQSSMQGMVGKFGNIASSATGLINTISGNLKTPEIQEQDFSANTKGVLSNKAQNFDGYDLGRTSTGGSALSGAASGASLGSVAGPWGAAIGGVVGGIGGAVSSIFGNKKRKKAEERANRRAVSQMNAQNTAINSNLITQELTQEYALGGSLLSPKNIFKCGGKKFANGGNFSNGVTIFGSGDSHDNNPNGGIPIGIGDNGEPNLVEENEVKWNDYIFSDRIKIPKYVNEFNLPKSLKKKSFAASAENLSKESKERPLDPISKRGLNTNLSKLSAMQETVREEKGMNQYAFGGQLSLNLNNNPLLNTENPINSTGYQNNDYSPNIKATGGWVHNSNGNDQIGNYLIRNGNFFANGGSTKSNGDVATKSQVTEAMKKAGFNDSEINTFLNDIIPGESAMNRAAHRTTKNKESLKKEGKYSGDYGLFQINYDAHKDKFSDLFTGDNWQDLDTQAAAAKRLYDMSGFGPWMGKKGDNQWGKNLSKEQLRDPEILKANRGVGSGASNADLKRKEATNNTITQPIVPEKVVKTNDITVNNPTDVKTVVTETPEITTTGTENSKTTKTNKSGKHPLRYAPIAANALLTGMAMSASPDRISLGRIAPMALGDKLQYNPMDSDYMANQMKQQGANTQRAITDASGGNRAIASAGLLAANRSSQDAIGNTLLQTREYNDNKLKEAKSFNRDTTMFNIKNDLSGQEYNTNALNQERLWNKQADASRRNAIRQGIATIGTSLGQVGTENRWMEVAQNLGDGYDSMGKYNRPVASALGGKIYYKKRIK